MLRFLMFVFILFTYFKLQNKNNKNENRAAVAQFVKHRAVMREVVSSIAPAGLSLRVLKQRIKKCCLSNYISKWLDFQVFSDNNCGTLKNLHPKSRARSSRCCALVSVKFNAVLYIQH